MRLIYFLSFLFLAFFSSLSFAQDFISYDKKTYDLWAKGDWKSLNEVATESIEKGFESKNIYYRRGVARYNLGDFNDSLPDFERVKEYDNADPYIDEYLYYNRLAIRDYLSARAGLSESSDAFRKKSGVSSFDIFSTLKFEAGQETYKFSDQTFLDNLRLPPNKEYKGNLSFWNLGWGQRWTYRFRTDLEFSTTDQTNIDTNIKTTGLYGGASYAFSNGLYLAAGNQSIQIKGVTEIPPPPGNRQVAGQTTTVSSSESAYGFLGYWRLNQFGLGVEYSKGTLNSSDQTQFTLELDAFVDSLLASLKAGNNTDKNDETSDNFSENGKFYQVQLRYDFDVIPLGFSVKYYSGDATNVIMDTAKTINNSTDRLDSAISASVDFEIFKPFRIFLHTRSSNKTDLTYDEKYTANLVSFGVYGYF